MVVYDSHNELDLMEIAYSGQCFRIKEIDYNKFLAVTGSHAVEIQQGENGVYSFCCEDEEFQNVWVPYFDLDTDYKVFKDQMQDDPFLKEAAERYGGLRILRQDLWEMVVTFTISQRNKIPRIARSVEILCNNFGSPLGEIGGRQVNAFPNPEQLANADLSVAFLGYREPYVKQLCEYGDEVWQNLRNQSDFMARETLMGMRGIGPKVADCVMLYGLHRMNSYPRDVWVNRMISDVYQGNFDPSKYSGFAGYVQQLQFHHYRNRYFTF